MFSRFISNNVYVHEYWFLWRRKQGMGSPGTGAIGGCVPPSVSVGSRRECLPLEEQHVLFAAEPSPQLP